MKEKSKNRLLIILLFLICISLIWIGYLQFIHISKKDLAKLKIIDHGISPVGYYYEGHKNITYSFQIKNIGFYDLKNSEVYIEPYDEHDNRIGQGSIAHFIDIKVDEVIEDYPTFRWKDNPSYEDLSYCKFHFEIDDHDIIFD